MNNAAQKSSDFVQNRAAGTQGFDFSDFGTVTIFHFRFCRSSLSLWAHQDTTETQPGHCGQTEGGDVFVPQYALLPGKGW